MALFKNKYRIESTRLPSWDYAREGMYFVTICTKGRECYFGDIDGGEMRLSAIGEVAEKEWYRTPELRPDMNLELGAFVVMPNHVHGIIMIGENPYNRDYEIVGDCRGAMHRASTINIHTINNDHKNQFGPQRKNLASILRGYKSAVTVRARKNNLAFCWQERFHDHIIRSMDDFHRISIYIKNNPGNWERDRFFGR